MDVKAYIESGVLELYAMEALPKAEASEVAALAAQYPAIQQEIERIHDALGAYASLYAREPEADLKRKILDKVQEQSQFITSERAVATQRTWVLPAIVAFLGLLVMGLLAYRWTLAEQRLQQIVAQQTVCDSVIARLNFINDPLTKAVPLSPKGLPVVLAPESEVTIYWNKTQQRTLLSIKNLRRPEPGTQYQLWSIAEGQLPQDAGVLNFETATLQEMKLVADAIQFAVTLEKEGGSQVPTLDKMYVVGSI